VVFETPEICSKMDMFERGTKWLIFRGPDNEHLELAQVL